MKKLIFILSLAFIVLTNNTANCQILTSSEHPIVIIDTEGEDIPDEPKITASMGIIYNSQGAMNNINDSPNHYNGFIGIETRGNSTQGFDKKTYSIETRTVSEQDTSVALLGMGEEEDWILHAMVIDKSQLRIPFSFYLSQQMGHYASNWRYVELIVNDEYRGLYILTEKIKRDNNRVDIAKLGSDDIAGDELTGGYILRIDWLNDPQGFESNYNSQGDIPMFYQWYYPKENNILPEQAAYIETWMDTFEDAVFSSDYTNNQGIRYTEYIDLNSFTDFLLMNELSKNSDGYKLSSYLHKDKDSNGGKLVAGPIWDFDQTYGVSGVCSNNDYTGWTYLQNQFDCEDLESMPMWWQSMMEDPIFQNQLNCRWEQFRQSFLHKDSINAWINMSTLDISEAIDRNFTVWDDFIGNSIWFEPSPIPQSYEEEIDYMQNWISNRIDWLDANIPGDCGISNVSQLSDLEETIEIYPNPTLDKVNILCEDLVSVELLNVYGRKLFETTLKEIDLNKYSKGIYFIKIRTKKQILTKKIVKH